MSYALENEEAIDLSHLSAILERLSEEIRQVSVVGNIERQTTTADSSEAKDNLNLGVGIDGKGPQLKADFGFSDTIGRKSEAKVTESGALRHRIHFGSLTKVLIDLVKFLNGKRILFVLDEWSNIPLDLQPYLADLIRRSMFPVRGFTVKIGAIEQRSRFRLSTQAGDYIGIEVGADAAADLNLDDFMVFGNDSTRAKDFFRELLYKHTLAIIGDKDFPVIGSSSTLQRVAFTQHNAFDEFVRAAEGVPRDAINIISVAALRAGDDPISVNHIRGSAKTWYERDKESAVAANPRARLLLHWIIDEVIGTRRARAFLLQSNVSHPLIENLFDSRVLHIIKKSVSASEHPGARFNVYALDFGCYVDLISTGKAPQGLFEEADDNGRTKFVEVPVDDYRSIRRAVLDLAVFESNAPELGISQSAK